MSLSQVTPPVLRLPRNVHGRDFVMDTFQVALEGRKRLEKADMSGVRGVGRVFVGHTVQNDGPKQFGNVYAVDTGAVFNLIKGQEQCGLTMVNMAFRTEALVNVASRGPQNVMTIDADPQDEKPFGVYASP
jgi:serine/threonine protein phosphatase 1